MKEIYFKVLLLGGLFLFNFPICAKVIYADAFIYKISKSIYSLEDLRRNNDNLKALKCYFPESLLVVVFDKLLKLGQDQSLFEIKDYTKVAYTQVQKNYFTQSLIFHKLKFYSDSHKTVVSKELVDAFYAASTKLSCGKTIFDENKDFTADFREVMRLELFLRSRYLPTEQNTKKTSTDLKQAMLGIKNLLSAMDRQITEETFW